MSLTVGSHVSWLAQLLFLLLNSKPLMFHAPDIMSLTPDIHANLINSKKLYKCFSWELSCFAFTLIEDSLKPENGGI